MTTSSSGTLRTALLAHTFSTGSIDALSFIALGHVFTANMTGNIVFLGFAIAGISGLSAARSATSLVAFMAGAVCGGIMHSGRAEWSQPRLLKYASAMEAALLLLATAFAVITPAAAYALIVVTAFAMGVRNAIVRKLAVPDLTTTVLTLTVTGLAAESSLAGGNNPRWATRLMSIVAMLAGAAAGALLLRYGTAAPLALSSVVAIAVFAVLRG